MREWIEVNYGAGFPTKGERCVVLVGYPLFYEIQEAVFTGDGKWEYRNKRYRNEKPDYYLPVPKFPF